MKRLLTTAIVVLGLVPSMAQEPERASYAYLHLAAGENPEMLEISLDSAEWNPPCHQLEAFYTAFESDGAWGGRNAVQVDRDDEPTIASIPEEWTLLHPVTERIWPLGIACRNRFGVRTKLGELPITFPPPPEPEPRRRVGGRSPDDEEPVRSNPCVIGFPRGFSYTGQCHSEDWSFFSYDASPSSPGFDRFQLYEGIFICGSNGDTNEDASMPTFGWYCTGDADHEWVWVPVR